MNLHKVYNQQYPKVAEPICVMIAALIFWGMIAYTFCCVAVVTATFLGW